jgi:glycosyltransferase involved in cell wall biosynthesis
MTKVLRIINRFNLGGPTYNAALLTKYLDSEFETLLIGGAEEKNEESSLHILHELGVVPQFIPSMQRSIHPLKDWLAYRDIKRLIKDFKPDIVHTHASKAGSIGRIAALHCNVPVIVHTFHGHVFHSYFGALKTACYKKIERFLAKKSQSIIVISAKQKEEICGIHQICAKNKATVIPLGFKLDPFQENKNKKRESFRTKYGLKHDDIAIGIIGRLVPIKHHRLFLDAMAEVIERSEKNIRLFIIGDGEERKAIEAHATALNISFGPQASTTTPLVFTSWIKNIDWAMAGLDIVALTSRNEGTPVSLIEAQASGKPIVTTNVGGIEDIVLPNETALLCSDNSTRQFATLTLELTENDTFREEMGTKGWAFVKERFHFLTLANTMSEHYRKLLDSIET